MSILAKLSEVDSNEERRALSRDVANLFFAAEERGLTASQKDEFGEILGNLLNAMDLGAREELSDRMADVAGAPHDLVMKMAKDEVRVAAPVLQRSAALSDKDLVEISANTTKDHRLAVSVRKNLSAVVTDELISHHEIDVMCAVVDNATSQISETGMKTLAQHGAEDQSLAKSLAERANLPPEVADKIMPALDEQAKAKLKAMLAGGHDEKLDSVLTEAKQTAAQKNISKKAKRLEAKALSKDIERGNRTLEEVTAQLAKESRARDLSLVFSEISLLPESKTFHAITDPNGEMLILISRAFDLPFTAYLEVERMRTTLLKLPIADENTLFAKFDAVAVAVAQKTMRFVNITMNVG